jgi:hypothetical protein
MKQNNKMNSNDEDNNNNFTTTTTTTAGDAVAQWLRFCDTYRKVAGSIQSAVGSGRVRTCSERAVHFERIVY